MANEIYREMAVNSGDGKLLCMRLVRVRDIMGFAVRYKFILLVVAVNISIWWRI